MEEIIKILLVDDDEVDRMAFKRALGKCGIASDLHVAENAKEALQILSKDNFDLIFLDYMLPGLDGLMLLNSIRDLKIFSPIIIVTAQGDETVAVQMIKAGAVDYLTKDFLSPDSLQVAIRNAIRFQKISEAKKKVEDALVESERRYRQIVETANDIIYKADHQGNFIYVNPVAVRKTGYPEGELLKKNFTDLIDQDMVEGIKAFYHEQFLKRIPSTYKEFVILTKNGDKMWVGQNVEIIFTPGNKVNGFAAVVREITLRKKMEIQMLQAKKEAEQSAMVKEQFLANMSHEIRTPMNAIIGFTDLLLKTKLDGEQKEFLSSIKNSGENLLYLINDILDFTKISANKITFEQIQFNVYDLIELATGLFDPRIKEKKIQLITEIDKTVPKLLYGDPYRLNQILLNLISNAIKFTEKGEVSVKLKAKEINKEMVALSAEVLDTGIGISQDKISNIFQSFTQASNETTRKYGGTGLGLSIVKNLVELQGGKISLESKEGRGSVFYFTIPYKTIGNGKQMPAGISKKPGRGFKGTVRILLAEDNELNQRLAKKVLSDFNFIVEVADNGNKALHKLEHGDFDIILMDIQMPELDGYAATRIIRGKFSESKKNIPIIAMTAHAMSGEIQKCMDAGMNEYISKPFKSDDLYNKICMLVGERKQQEEEMQRPVSDRPGLYADLSYLKDLCSGNHLFMSEMIQTFFDQLDVLLPKMETYLKDKDWKQLEEIAHILKSSIAVMRIESLMEPISKIEKFSSEAVNLNEIPRLLETVKSISLKAVEELKEELSGIQK
jgi:PAS domain S-box-containing protein